MRLRNFQITPLRGYTTRMCGYATPMGGGYWLAADRRLLWSQSTSLLFL